MATRRCCYLPTPVVLLRLECVLAQRRVPLLHLVHLVAIHQAGNTVLLAVNVHRSLHAVVPLGVAASNGDDILVFQASRLQLLLLRAQVRHDRLDLRLVPVDLRHESLQLLLLGPDFLQQDRLSLLVVLLYLRNIVSPTLYFRSQALHLLRLVLLVVQLLSDVLSLLRELPLLLRQLHTQQLDVVFLAAHLLLHCFMLLLHLLSLAFQILFSHLNPLLPLYELLVLLLVRVKVVLVQLVHLVQLVE